eukprot:GHVU01226911.1.p3 GENE.GHVU01226911.1~~GHVU01226911.1.p3  ORF type:complete len:114 (-),score=7.58 GHVU01226911.1:998-1339(-)
MLSGTRPMPPLQQGHEQDDLLLLGDSDSQVPYLELPYAISAQLVQDGPVLPRLQLRRTIRRRDYASATDAISAHDAVGFAATASPTSHDSVSVASSSAQPADVPKGPAHQVKE